MATSAESKVSTDHDEIRQWAEERGAQPSCVRGTGGEGDIGMLRLDFPGYSGEESLEHISWDEWFEKFDERGLALLHQETTAAGERSNFNKLVSRETADEIESGRGGSRSGAKKGGSRGGGKSARKTGGSRSAKKTQAKSASRGGSQGGAKKTAAKKGAAKKSSSGKAAKVGGKKTSGKKATTTKSTSKKSAGKKAAAKKSSRSR